MSEMTAPPTQADRSVVLAARALAASLLRHQPQRYRHVEGAARAAAQVAMRIPEIPQNSVVAAAWLHDIGYADELHDTGFHPLDGATFLREGGWDPEIVRLVAHHSHSRLLAPYFGADVALSRFAVPVGLAADVVTFADVVAGVSGSGVTVSDRIAELRTRTNHGPAIPDQVRETRYRLLRQSADNVRWRVRRGVRTGD